MIKAVTFDLWNTLIHNRNYVEFRLPALNQALQSRGIVLEPDALLEAYQSGFRYSMKTIPAEGYRHVQTSEIVEKVLESIDVENRGLVDELAIMYEEAILCDVPQLKPGVYEALEHVSGKYKIGMISVTGVSPGRIIRDILKKYGLYRYFDAFSFSDEVGYVKPNIKLFTIALEMLDVDPSETVHVGDSYKSDIVGALDAGMKVIWIKTKEQETRPDYKPDAVIESLTEFPRVFRGLV